MDALCNGASGHARCRLPVLPGRMARLSTCRRDQRRSAARLTRSDRAIECRSWCAPERVARLSVFPSCNVARKRIGARPRRRKLVYFQRVVQPRHVTFSHAALCPTSACERCSRKERPSDRRARGARQRKRKRERARTQTRGLRSDRPQIRVPATNGGGRQRPRRPKDRWARSPRSPRAEDRSP